MQDQEPVKFGLGQITNKTPDWAKWAFRVFFYITQTVNLGIIIFTNIPAETKLQVTQWVQFGNLAVHGLTKLFGIPDDTTQYYENNKQ